MYFTKRLILIVSGIFVRVREVCPFCFVWQSVNSKGGDEYFLLSAVSLEDLGSSYM